MVECSWSIPAPGGMGGSKAPPRKRQGGLHVNAIGHTQWYRTLARFQFGGSIMRKALFILLCLACGAGQAARQQVDRAAMDPSAIPGDDF